MQGRSRALYRLSLPLSGVGCGGHVCDVLVVLSGIAITTAPP